MKFEIAIQYDNYNKIWSKTETSQCDDERKWNNNKKKFEYKLDQTFKIIMHAHDDAFLPSFNCNIHDNPWASWLVKTKLINLHLLYNCSCLFLAWT